MKFLTPERKGELLEQFETDRDAIFARMPREMADYIRARNLDLRQFDDEAVFRAAAESVLSYVETCLDKLESTGSWRGDGGHVFHIPLPPEEELADVPIDAT